MSHCPVKKQTAMMMLVISCLALTSCTAVTDRGISARQLTCEYAHNPLGIDTPAPRFSWLLESSQRGQTQSAYHILVASSEQKLKDNIGDKWDSGKVESDRSVNIEYLGKPLASREKCWWKVRVWDKHGKAGDYSSSATFEMGLLTQSDWKGKWIGVHSNEAVNFITGKFNQAVPLDGRRQSIKIPHHAKLKPAGEITISAWIKPTECTPRWRVIYRKEDGSSRHVLAIGKTGEVFGLWVGLGIGGAYVERGAPLEPSYLTDGKWHLVAATYDGKSVSLYADGKQIASTPMHGPMDTTGSKPAYIGSSHGGAEFFPGGIDDVRIYDRALSAAEVKQRLSETPKTAGRNLAGWWKLDGDLTSSAGGPSGKMMGGKVSSPLLRKEFEIDKKVERARVYVSGLGWSELYINGKKVSEDVLSPNLTDYSQEVLYRTYDVTDLLKPGSNAMGLMLGNGWYCGAKVMWLGRPWAQMAQAMLQLTVTCEDGTEKHFVTDETWRGGSGAIGTNDIKPGETYDARLEKPHWNKVGYDDSQWTDVAVLPAPRGRLKSQTVSPMKVQDTLRPIKITQHESGGWLFEFDRYFGGWVLLKTKGKAGNQITIHYELGEKDTYILNGNPDGETYEPRFTFHPVRYVRVEGLEEEPTPDTILGREVYSDVDMYGRFSCSNDLLNQIHANIERTLKVALKGFMLDCLHREPIYYNEPATFSGSLSARKSMPNLWTELAWGITLAGSNNGDLSDIVPRLPGMNRRSDVSQNAAYPMLVWYLYQCHGDERLLKQHCDRVKAWVDFISREMARDDHIVTKGWLGEHMWPKRDTVGIEFISKETPKDFIWTCFYYHNARTLAGMCQVLRKKEQAEHYAKLAQEIKTVINKTWLDPTTGHYATKSQTSEILPLAIDIVPQKNKQQLIDNIAKRITETDGGKLRVGHVGLPGFMESLVENGLGEIVYNAVNHTEFPGWGFMISQGATTVWEGWCLNDSGYRAEESMTMLAGVGRLFYESIAGIQEPSFYGTRQFGLAYSHFHIKPHVLGDLKHAEASIKTVRGKVSSSWKRTDNSLLLETTIPVNSTAKVSVPKIGLQNVTVSESGKTVYNAGQFLEGAAGIASAQNNDKYVTFDVGSGSYSFRLTGRK